MMEVTKQFIRGLVRELSREDGPSVSEAFYIECYNLIESVHGERAARTFADNVEATDGGFYIILDAESMISMIETAE